MHSHTSLAVGSVFEERYENLEPLGEGGFGAVFKARQRTTGQPVALKIMRLPQPHGAARVEKRVARFLRETRLCAQLHHPNIVQLIDSGQTAQGLLYTVFAFAPGDNLADLLAREGALSLHETRHLMLQVLDALACAHAGGVVHRDLKPRNIMVIPTGARRNAALLDFGLGVMIEDASAQGPMRLTATEETLGTPGYAAPEQLRGLEPSPSADLFAWGLVFLECLTGKPVYTGATLAEILYAQLSPEPVTIPASLEGHRLGELLRAVTHKDPAARQLSAHELVAALESCDLGGLTRQVRTGAMGGAAAAEAASPMGLAADPPRGERRQVTAVCCAVDAIAVTPGALDIEEPDERLRALLERCAEIVLQHRGHLAGTFGHQAMFYFGYPHAEEDDTRRAARAALALGAAFATAGERGGAVQGARFGLKIGIHTGLVVAAPGAGLVVGLTPQLAARAASLAQPGAIAVTAEAQRLLRTAFAFEAQGEHVLEGQAEPIRLFRLQGELRERAPAPTSNPHPTSLIGREEELALLLERWRRAQRGAGQCSLLTGEPGIGKSRLAREVREHVSGQGHTFLECRCSPETQNNALFPVIGLLGHLVQREARPSMRARGEALEALLSRHGLSLAETMPLFGSLLSLPLGERYPPLDASPQRQKELTLNAVLSLLSAMAEEQPIFLLAEDLHWADPTTLELLTQLVHEAPSSPMCVLFTARLEFAPPFPTMGLLQLHLSRLQPGQVEAMMIGLVQGKGLPERVIAEVVGRTDGVPLFVEELTQMMVESGALALRGERYELMRPLAQVEIPASLRDLLAARLDRLGRARGTAQIAATLGREFGLELLQAVSPLDREAVRQDVDKLVAAGLVHKRRRSGEPGYAFKHALIRDAAYESLPKAERRRLHEHIAETLRAQSPQWEADRPELLAHHYTEAGLAERAIPYWLQGGQRAAGQSANLEAIRHFDRALGLLATLPETPGHVAQELGLRLALSAALTASRGYAAPEVGATYERARELCDQLGDSRQLFPVIWGLGAFHAVRAQLDSALELSVRALNIAEHESDAALLVPAHLLHGGSHLWRGALVTARGHFERGLSFYEAGKHSALAAVYSYDPGIATLSYLALCLWFLGEPEQALQRARAAVVQTRAMGHAHSQVHSLVRAAQVALLRREGSTVLADIQSLIAISEDKGFPMWRAAGLYLRGHALSQAGQPARGIEDIRAGIQSILETGAHVGHPEYLAALAEAYGQSGQLEKALETVAEALEVVARTGQGLYEAELYRLRGELTLRSDPTTAGEERAEASLNQALELARRAHAKSWERRAVISLARLWESQGRHAAARDLLRAAHGEGEA